MCPGSLKECVIDKVRIRKLPHDALHHLQLLLRPVQDPIGEPLLERCIILVGPSQPDRLVVLLDRPPVILLHKFTVAQPVISIRQGPGACILLHTRIGGEPLLSLTVPLLIEGDIPHAVIGQRIFILLMRKWLVQKFLKIGACHGEFS